MFAQAYKVGLEDVVSKVRDSAYTSDRGKLDEDVRARP